jgi:hypothetical protein
MHLSLVAILGLLCVLAGFLVIVASVVFVYKGRALLGESGTPNEVAWGKIKANLTSIVALFVLGLVAVALPFYFLQKAEARQPPEAILKGKISGAGGRAVRLIFVEEPDYDRDYKDEFTWRVPLIPNKEYSVLYVTDDKTIINEQPVSVERAGPGSASQTISLATFDLQNWSSIAPDITPKKETSDADLKSHGIH